MIRHLDAAALAAVAQLAPEAYGVAVRARIGQMFGGKLPSIGAVHLALGRLERRGWLRASAGKPTPVRGGRATRLFSLTAAGTKALDRQIHEAEAFVDALAPSWRPS